jgi:hypothetical protein
MIKNWRNGLLNELKTLILATLSGVCQHPTPRAPLIKCGLLNSPRITRIFSNKILLIRENPWIFPLSIFNSQLRQLQNFSFQLPTYQGSVLEAFRRTKHGPVAKRQLVLHQAQFNRRFPRRLFCRLRPLFCAVLLLTRIPVTAQDAAGGGPLPASGGQHTAAGGQLTAAGKWTKFWVGVHNYWHYTPDYSTHREPARNFEIGSSLSAGFAWDLYLGFLDIFKQDADIRIDFNHVLKNFSSATPKGLNINGQADYQFIYTKFKYKQNQSFGFSLAGINALLDVNLSEDLFAFFARGNIDKHNIEPAITVSGAVFVELAALEWKRRIFGQYFVTVQPAWYIPLVYIPKSAQKIKIAADSHFAVDMEGGVNMYIPFSFTNGFEITNLGGVDVNFTIERPIFSILDAGLELTHLPLMPSVLSNAGQIGMEGKILDSRTSFTEGLSIKIPELEQFYSVRNFWVFRPVGTELYALYRPFGRDSLFLRPNIGLTFLNPDEQLHFNFGLKASATPVSFFTFTFFTGMQDHMAKNIFSFLFHWYRFGFYLKLDLRSQDYLRSWTMKGAGISAGWYFGY